MDRRSVPLLARSPLKATTLPVCDMPHFFVHACAGSVGVPVPSVEIRLVDVPDLEYYAADNKGEVCVRGFSVFSGYHNDTEKTAEVHKENCSLSRTHRLSTRMAGCILATSDSGQSGAHYASSIVRSN
jgi:acyl-CoA synthetase (AMP-forming)/AMP-acid ligase II